MKRRPPHVRVLLGSLPSEKLALLRSAFSARRQAAWRARRTTDRRTTFAFQSYRTFRSTGKPVTTHIGESNGAVRE
jgi:hypothetical protein